MSLPEHLPTRLRLNPEVFVVSHQADVTFDPVHLSLRAADVVRLSRVPASGVARFRFMKSMKIDALSLPYSFKNDTLEVRFPSSQGALPGSFTLRYHGSIDNPRLLSEDWWVPSNVGDQGPSSLSMTVPERYQVAASGSPDPVVERAGHVTFHWHFGALHPGMAWMGGSYRIHSYRLHGLPIRIFLPPDSRVSADALARRADSCLQYFARQWGPYPYDKLDILQEGHGTQADTESSLIGIAPSVLSDRSLLDDYMPHEISHNWWSNAIEGYSQDSLWFEPMAQESAELYQMDHGQANEVLRDRRQALVDWTRHYGTRGSTPIADLVTYDGPEVEDVAYNKGWFVMSQLHDWIGDPAFRRGLRRFATAWTGRLPTWTDIEKSFEQSSGQDLSWFFDQWLERRGAADLTLESTQIRPGHGGWTVSGRIRQSGDIYRLRVPLLLRTASGPVETIIPLDSALTPFTMYTTSRPGPLELDPRVRIFRLLTKP